MTEQTHALSVPPLLRVIWCHCQLLTRRERDANGQRSHCDWVRACFKCSVGQPGSAANPMQALGLARESGTWDASLCLLLKHRTDLPRHMPLDSSMKVGMAHALSGKSCVTVSSLSLPLNPVHTRSTFSWWESESLRSHLTLLWTICVAGTNHLLLDFTLSSHGTISLDKLCVVAPGPKNSMVYSISKE